MFGSPGVVVSHSLGFIEEDGDVFLGRPWLSLPFPLVVGVLPLLICHDIHTIPEVLGWRPFARVKVIFVFPTWSVGKPTEDFLGDIAFKGFGANIEELPIGFDGVTFGIFLLVIGICSPIPDELLHSSHANEALPNPSIQCD